jgi:hypothetical protein
VQQDVKEQMLTRIKCSPKFALQIDSCCRINSVAFIKYCFEENIQEELTFYVPFSGTCTESDIFKAVNDYFTAEDVFSE